MRNIKRAAVVRLIGTGIKRSYKKRFRSLFSAYTKWKTLSYSLLVDRGTSALWFPIDWWWDQCKKLHERLWIRDLWTRVLFFVIARDFGMGHLKTFQTFTIDHKSVEMHARFMQFWSYHILKKLSLTKVP